MALGLVSATAHAHAPPLGARVLSPAGDGDEVIVTNRGLVFRDREDGSARLLCNEALRITTFELPNVTLLGDGALLVASSSGLRLSRDQGCTWSDVGQMQYTNTPALAADPADPDRVVIASYDSDAPGLRITRDAGASWAPLYPSDEGDFVFSLQIAGADSATIYATLATYAAGAPAVHSLLRTRDGGASWQRSVLPLSERDYSARVAAVDPRDAATLVLYTVANSPGLDSSRLLVSRDGGDTFDVALELPEIRGAGYAGDGTLWVAARDGLYSGDSELGTFTPSSTASELGCVLERAGSLVVCGHYAGLESATSGIGISSDGGHSFEPWLDFRSVDAAVECPAGSLTAALCAQPWLDWELEMTGQLAATPGGGSPGAAGLDAPAGYGAAGGTPDATPGGAPAPDSMSGAPEAERDLDADAAARAGCALGAPLPSSAPEGSGILLGLGAAAWLRRRTARINPSVSVAGRWPTTPCRWRRRAGSSACSRRT